MDEVKKRPESINAYWNSIARETLSGRQLKPTYRPADTQDIPYQAIGDPGQYPYTRGIDAAGYQERLWSIAQLSGFGLAEESAERFNYLQSQGQTAVGVVFDLPTELGYDSDDPLCEGEVGRVGVAIDTVEDIKVLLERVPFEDMDQPRLAINAPTPIILAMIWVAAGELGKDCRRYRFAFQNDVLKEYIARGTYIFPPQPTLRLAHDVVDFCLKELPSCVPLTVCSNHSRGAGCNAAEEIAFALADAIAYSQYFISRGLAFDAFAPRLLFSLASHIGFFEEIAKLRAARQVWAGIARERFGAKDPASMRMRLYTPCIGSPLSPRQPELNIARSTVQALAAILGGTQSVQIASMDEALGLATDVTATISIRIQQMLALETDAALTCDPLGGSYLVEALTAAMALDIRAELEAIEERGGAVPCIHSNYFKRKQSLGAQRYQRNLESGQRRVVSINCFRDDPMARYRREAEEPAVAAEAAKIARLRALKARRDQGRVDRALDRVRSAAASEDNIIPSLIEAAAERVSLGEICGALREVFGTYEPPPEQY